MGKTESQKKGKWSYDKWYKEHSHELSAKKRERYRKDPEYRAKILARAKQRRLSGAPAKGRVKRFFMGGKTIEGYNIRYPANTLGVTTQAIVKWEKKGLIPEPTLPGNHRYYTAKQVELLIHYFDKVKKAGGHKPEIVEWLKSKWNA